MRGAMDTPMLSNTLSLRRMCGPSGGDTMASNLAKPTSSEASLRHGSPSVNTTFSVVGEVDGYEKSVGGVNIEAIRTGRGLGPTRVVTTAGDALRTSVGLQPGIGSCSASCRPKPLSRERAGDGCVTFCRSGGWRPLAVDG